MKINKGNECRGVSYLLEWKLCNGYKDGSSNIKRKRKRIMLSRARRSKLCPIQLCSYSIQQEPLWPGKSFFTAHQKEHHFIYDPTSFLKIWIWSTFVINGQLTNRLILFGWCTDGRLPYPKLAMQLLECKFARPKFWNRSLHLEWLA